MMDEGYVPAKGGTLSVSAVHCLESDVFFTVVFIATMYLASTIGFNFLSPVKKLVLIS